jgi:hypothetical protein
MHPVSNGACKDYETIRNKLYNLLHSLGPEGEEVMCLCKIALLHPLISIGTQKVHKQYNDITLLR